MPHKVYVKGLGSKRWSLWAAFKIGIEADAFVIKIARQEPTWEVKYVFSGHRFEAA